MPPENAWKQIYSRSPVLDAGGRTRRKPAEASMDWKPNAHTAPGLGIEPGPIGA